MRIITSGSVGLGSMVSALRKTSATRFGSPFQWRILKRHSPATAMPPIFWSDLRVRAVDFTILPSRLAPPASTAPPVPPQPHVPRPPTMRSTLRQTLSQSWSSNRALDTTKSSACPDASARADGTLDLIRNYQGLATLEFHGPKMDVYFNTGAEYASRAATFDPVTLKAVGYGAPSFNNSGCFTEAGPGSGGFLPGGLGSSCTADTRVLIEGTAGFWYKIYDGSKEKVNRGRIQFGPQYSYVTRNTWSGALSAEPHGIDNMIFTSFRYYLP